MRLAREKERELAELERATRTVFAYNLNVKADERDLFQFFSVAGQVLDIRLITDRNTKRSKGLAYVEFARQEDVFNAVALTGQMLLGQAIMIKASEAEKNLAWEAAQAAKQQAAAAGVEPPPPAGLAAPVLAAAAAAAAAGGALPGPPPLAAPPQPPRGPQPPSTAPPPSKLQVSNIPAELSESDLQQLFSPFGTLTATQVVRDTAGRSAGYAYVTFAALPDATNALNHWHGRQLATFTLQVQAVPLNYYQAPPPPVAAPPAPPEPAPAPESIDEEEGHFKLTAQTRAALMSRLASTAGLAPVPTTVPPLLPGMPGYQPPPAAAAPPPAPHAMALDQGVLGPASPIPTPCLLIKNMFDPAAQTEPNWDLEIADDVRDEASRFGPVSHVFVDKDSKVRPSSSSYRLRTIPYRLVPYFVP